MNTSTFLFKQYLDEFSSKNLNKTCQPKPFPLSYTSSILDDDNTSTFPKEKTEEFTLGLEQILERFAYFALTCLLLLLATIETRKRFLKSNGSNENGIRINRNRKTIPYYSHLTLFGRRIIPLPTIVDGIVGLIQTKYDGVKVFERIAREVQKSGFALARMAAFDRTFIAIADPVLLKKVLGSGDIRLLNKPKYIYDMFLPGPFQNGMVSADVRIWRPHRKILSGCFTYKALQSYVGVMNKHGRNLASNLILSCKGTGNDSPLKGKLLYDAVYYHALKIIFEIVVGEGSLTDEESEEVHFHFEATKTLIVHKLMNPHNLLSWVWWLNPKRKAFDYHFSQLEKYIYIAIEKCKKKMELEKDTEVEEKLKSFRSLIDEMLHHNASPNEIYDEAGTFVAAGHEATSTTITFFLQHIAEHPEIQIRCQEELDALFDSKTVDGVGNDLEVDLTMNDLSDLKYLERCILETLRLTAPVPFYLRHVQSGGITIEEYHFEKGETLMIPVWTIHKDPIVYPNPDLYDPDRFLPENVEKRHPYTFLPFSIGPRGCLGNKVAIMEIKVILANILRHFDVLTSDKVKDIPLLFDLTTKPAREYNISLKRRRT